jgi:hypothetical protein
MSTGNAFPIVRREPSRAQCNPPVMFIATAIRMVTGMGTAIVTMDMSIRL